MSPGSKVTERGVRMRLLRLEAESHRLEIAANWRELRKPMTHLKQAPVWLGIFGLIGMFLGKSRGMGPAASLLGALRMNWLAKVLPLAATAWRAVGLLSGLLSKVPLPKKLRFR